SVQGGDGVQGRADGDSGTHNQRIWTGRSGRRKKRHASAEEIERGRAAGISFALWDSNGGRGDCEGAVLSAGGRQRRDSLSAGAARGAGRLCPAAEGAVRGCV